MTSPDRSSVLRRDLAMLRRDGVAWGVMTGSGELYLVAFALALGVSEVTAGLLASVPLLLGAMMQLVTPWGVRHIGSVRRWVAACAFAQACSFVPLVVGAIVGALPTWVLFACAAIYWATGFASGPPWQAWATSLVPGGVRASFFANRSRFVQSGIALGLVGSGTILEFGRRGRWELLAFASVLGLAVFARLVSSAFLARQTDMPVDAVRRFDPPSPRIFTEFLADRRARSLLAYMLATVFCVQVAGPYYTPYMLEQCAVPYWELMLIYGSSFASKILVLPTLGRIAKRSGPAPLLWVGGLGIVPAGSLWLVSTDFWYLLVLQAVVGVFWACWETATFLLVFDAIPQERRTALLTFYNAAYALAVLGGSLVGATLLRWIGTSETGYAVLFATTGVMRAVTVFLLVAIAPTRFRPRIRILAMRPLALRPGAASLDTPIVDTIPAETAPLAGHDAVQDETVTGEPEPDDDPTARGG